MIPLIPTLSLSILSLLSSAFIVLRTVIPLIPNNRVHPRKRNHIKAVSLSQSDKAHIWLASLDVFALAVFVWEVFVENLARPVDFDVAKDSASSARLLFVLTLRQTCLLVIAAITLFQVRRAKPSSFGPFHCMVWLPTLVITVIAIAIAGVLANLGLESFHIGAASYSSTTAVLTALAIVYLVTTLYAIRRNLAPYSETDDSWQHVIAEGKSCYSFPTEDVEALKDGSSWITSNAESCHDSISAFSFESTVRSVKTTQNANGQQGSDTESQHDSSWLTEPSVSLPTMTEWSFPTTCAGSWVPPSTTLDIHTRLHGSYACSCPITPALSSTQFMGGHSRNPTVVNKGNVEGLGASSKPLPKSVDVSWLHILGWLAFIWIPLGFSLPYLFATSSRGSMPVLFILSIAISAPMLAFNVIFSPLPIPTDLFEDLSNLPKSADLESRYKRSGSITIVEGRRSGDIWLTKGDAFDGKNRFSRATSLLSRVPKLSVLPVQSAVPQGGSRCNTVHCTLQDNSATTSAFVAIEAYDGEEMDRLSCLDGRDDSHVTSTDSGLPVTHDFIAKSCSSMLSQSAIPSAPASRRSSISSRSSRGSRPYKGPFTTNLETILDVSLNTPQNYARTKSPDGEPRGVSFRAGGPTSSSEAKVVSCPSSQTHQDLITSIPPLRTEGRIKEIDALSARLLPLLVPGLRIGADIDVQKSPGNSRRSLTSSLSFSSPELASTPPPVSSYGKNERKVPSTEATYSIPAWVDAAAQKNASMRVNASDEALICRVAETRPCALTQLKSTLEHDTPNSDATATHAVSVCRKKSTRIPRRVQALMPIESSVELNADSQKLNPNLSKMSLTSPTLRGEDTSRQRRPSLIPVPVRMREVGVAYGIESAGRHPQQKQGSQVSGLRTPNVVPPSKSARSVSDKKGFVLRSGQR